MKRPRQVVLSVLATLVLSSVAQAQSSNQSQSSPVFTITPVQSKITFYVKSSVKLEGVFEKWDATLVFTSTDASTGVLDVKIQADSVNSRTKSKDQKLKGEHCFDVEKDLHITFLSTKITQTGPNTFDVAGTLRWMVAFISSQLPTVWTSLSTSRQHASDLLLSLSSKQKLFYGAKSSMRLLPTEAWERPAVQELLTTQMDLQVR